MITHHSVALDQFQDESVSLPSLASQPRGLAELIEQSALIGRLPFEAPSHAKIVESIRTGNISREVAKCVPNPELPGCWPNCRAENPTAAMAPKTRLIVSG